MNAIAYNMHQQACKAQVEHEKRLARIVVDQWMHIANKRLTMACCFQMVHCWRKICSENRRIKQQNYLDCEHHSCKKFPKKFYAYCEENEMKQRNQSIAIAFYKKILQKRTLKGFNMEQINLWRYHKEQIVKNAFHTAKRYYEMKKIKKRTYNGAQLFYDNALKKQALHGLFKHREKLKLKLFSEEAASCHWKQHMKSRILKCWGIISKRILNLNEKRDQSRIQFLKSLLRRCMKNWFLVTQVIFATREGKIAQASQQYNKSYKKRILQAWTQWCKEKQSKKLKLGEATMMHNRRMSSIVTNAWHSYAIEKEKRRVQASIVYNFKRRQSISDSISIWKAYQAKKAKARIVALKALTHLKKNLTKKSMAAWRPWHEKHISRKYDREKALDIYKSRLERWACERILAVGLMLHSLRHKINVKRQLTSSALPYMKVAPYARKWWYIPKRHSNLRKTLLHQIDERSSKNIQKEDEQLLSNKESFLHEVVLRIGIDKDGLKIHHERPPLPQQERPQPRGRELLALPSPTPSLLPTLIPMSATIRQRLVPRRPAF